MRAALNTAIVAALIALALFAHTGAQQAALIFGSNSGVTKAIAVDASGNMNVTIGAGTVPIANGGTGTATAAATSVFGNPTGSTAAPSFTTAPSVVSLTAKGGTGTGTFKAGGQICDTVGGTCSCSTMTDAATINQWNVITCTLPASSLAANGDEILLTIEFQNANNANTKEYQAYWNGGTCSGTGATMCSSGTSLWGSGITTTSAATLLSATGRIKRTTSGNQDLLSRIMSSTAIIGTGATTASVTDTNTIAIAFGGRNTSASAATFGTPTAKMRVAYSGQ